MTKRDKAAFLRWLDRVALQFKIDNFDNKKPTFIQKMRQNRRAALAENVDEIFAGERRPEHPKIHDSHKRLSCNPVVFTSDMYLRQSFRANWANCKEDIAKFSYSFILELRKKGIPFYAHCAWRNEQDQDLAFREGRSKKRYPNSKHNRGEAVDLVHSHYHWELTKREWEYIGTIGREVAHRIGVKVRWGGDWDMDGTIVLDDDDEKFWDPAHWELFQPRPQGVIKPGDASWNASPHKLKTVLR